MSGPASAGGLEEILRGIAESSRRDALLDSERLRRALIVRGAGERDALGLCLLATVGGWRRVVAGDTPPAQADLDRLVRNGCEQAGLTRARAMELVTAVCRGLGVAVELEGHSGFEGVARAVAERAYVVPASLYEKELEGIEEAMERAKEGRGPLQASVLARIEALVAAGSPQAKRYLACAVLNKLAESDVIGSDGGEPRRALLLLTEAAAAGDAEADALLGDYQLESGVGGWSRALGHYTGLGAMALTPRRRKAVARILAQRRYVRASLVSSCWLAGLLFLLAAAAAEVGHLPAPPWAVVCAASAVGTLAGAVALNRANPHRGLSAVPAALFGIWATFVAACLLG